MPEKRTAILIASSRFPDESLIEELCCPENDVEGLNQILRSPMRGEFDETFVLKNEPHNQILLRINRVLREATPEDLALIYYSGHGKLNPAGRLHLATVDTRISTLEATSIPVDTIKNFVDVSLSNKIVLLLDCCFAGAIGSAFTRGDVPGQLQLASEGLGTYIMSASTGIQNAVEKEGDDYGLFTKHIIQGISEGEADLDGDGLISMDELYRYVHDQVLLEGFQEPMKWDINVQGRIINVARSGRVLWQERGREIRNKLLELSGGLHISDAVLSKCLPLTPSDPSEFSEKTRRVYALLGELTDERIGSADFGDRFREIEERTGAATRT